jgi:hypothetical protein
VDWTNLASEVVFEQNVQNVSRLSQRKEREVINKSRCEEITKQLQ